MELLPSDIIRQFTVGLSINDLICFFLSSKQLYKLKPDTVQVVFEVWDDIFKSDSSQYATIHLGLTQHKMLQVDVPINSDKNWRSRYVCWKSTIKWKDIFLPNWLLATNDIAVDSSDKIVSRHQHESGLKAARPDGTCNNLMQPLIIYRNDNVQPDITSFVNIKYSIGKLFEHDVALPSQDEIDSHFLPLIKHRIFDVDLSASPLVISSACGIFKHDIFVCLAMRWETIVTLPQTDIIALGSVRCVELSGYHLGIGSLPWTVELMGMLYKQHEC